MKKTQLQTQIEHINDHYDEMEEKLKAERKQHIEIAWKDAVASGQLKQDLS